MPPAQSSPTRTSPRLTTAAEVRLGDQQQRQDAEHRQHRDEQRRRRQVPLAQGEHVRAPQREDQLGQLRGLEVREAQVEPLPGAVELEPDARAPGRAAAGRRRRSARSATTAAGTRPAAAAPRASRRGPAPAQISCWTPGAQAGWSSSAASIEEAEKTMTRPMASSRPAGAEHQVAAGHRAVEPGGPGDAARRGGPLDPRGAAARAQRGLGSVAVTARQPSARTASAKARPRCA